MNIFIPPLPLTQQVVSDIFPSYCMNERSVEHFFAPAHRIDRVLRNDFRNKIE